MALRVIGGFIRTTPIHVMESEVCLLPLFLRRKYLATKYCLKAQSWTNNITIKLLRSLTELCQSLNILRNRTPLLVTIYNDTKVEHINTSNPLHSFNLVTWVSNINMNFIDTTIESIKNSKSTYDNRILRYNTLQMLNSRFYGWHKIYTDGSQTQIGQGAAFYDPSRNVKESYKFNQSKHSIMIIELFAISEALSHVVSEGLKKVIILSDSKSALHHIARCSSGDRGASIAYTILEKVLMLAAGGVELRLQWVPSHVGIHGNEEADNLARQAISNGTEVHLKQEYTEVLLSYKNRILTQWKEYFDITSREKGIWYKTIQSEPPHVPWCGQVKMSRKLIVVAHRIRSGHMPLNKFKFIMKKVDSPNCEMCGVVDDVYHLLVDCIRSTHIRKMLNDKFKINHFDVGLVQSILAEQTCDAARLLYQSVHELFNTNL